MLACIAQEQIREVARLRHQLAQSEQMLDEARKVSARIRTAQPAVRAPHLTHT